MKKINFETIRKIVYILVLIIAVTVIITFSVRAIKDHLPRKKAKTAQIKVVDSEDEEETEDTTESIDYLTKLDDVYVFAVSSSAIKSDELSLPTTMGIEMSNAIGQSIPRYGSSQIINLLFVKNGQETSLFSSKAFIYKYQLKNSYYPSPESASIYSYSTLDHDFNIYAVIKNDTNNDKILDSKDNISLYVSDYDGNNLQELSPSIYYFTCTDNNVFVFSEYNEGKISFYEYDGNLKKVSLITTFEKELTEKRINLW